MSGSSWDERVAAVWQQAEQLDGAELVRRIDALAGERPDDPRALAEQGGARDAGDDEAGAERFYRAAMEAGLAEPELGQVVIQLASTVRNLGRAEESAALLRDYFGERPDHELASAADAFLALALHSAGRAEEAVPLLLRALAPHLPRYRRSVLGYSGELERGPGSSPR